jgi:alpha/beta superfamily hydrolase
VPGPAGALEALLEEPEDGDPREACLVCHPHPLYGGTMRNKVVYRMARALRRSGAAVLRFNFRGVGSSEGTHDNGAGEVDDARESLAWLRARYPALPFTLAGFSFGARVILKLGCAAADARRLIAVGYPTKRSEHAILESCAVPKYFVHSTRDEHGPREEIEAVFAAAATPKRLVWVPAEDHFFTGALDPLEQAVFELPW